MPRTHINIILSNLFKKIKHQLLYIAISNVISGKKNLKKFFRKLKTFISLCMCSNIQCINVRHNGDDGILLTYDVLQ